ncbi:chymotrypsinogen B-like [Archocentrus centrarchus]|uniref:chymotrypsinogen B-like n=1 Tax=Archocentrus centrarchus TaxID=63155 RepID=UPI0011EA2E8C|nr:chymotrypsinogen B-like [Archocentrus centrarchus]
MKEVHSTMALQQFVCCFTVLIIFLCKGSEQLTCGTALKNNRIIGGQDATSGSWPWHALVNYLYGGTLITDQWVLTAASITPLVSSNVYLGRYTLSGLNPNEVTRTVEEVTCHPNYNDLTLENDICLLKLSAPVNFTDYIRPICLASENSTFNSDTISWAISFFSQTEYDSEFTPVQQEVNLPIVGNSECIKTYSDPVLESAIKNGICAGAVGKTPCSFDEGGPLMTKKESVWVQSGVLSFTSCKGLGLYTRVSRYQKWINDTVTGTPPGFVTVTSSTSPLSATAPPTLPPTAPTTVICQSVFCCGENLIHFTHFTSLCALVVLLHIFAGIGGT